MNLLRHRGTKPEPVYSEDDPRREHVDAVADHLRMHIGMKSSSLTIDILRQFDKILIDEPPETHEYHYHRLIQEAQDRTRKLMQHYDA